MPSSPGQNCPECSGQEGGISAHFRFCVYASQMFLVLIKLRNWKRPSWDQYGTTLTQSLPKATGTCPVPCLRSEGQIDLFQVPCTTQLISLGNLGGGGEEGSCLSDSFTVTYILMGKWWWLNLNGANCCEGGEACNESRFMDAGCDGTTLMWSFQYCPFKQPESSCY